MTSRLPEGWEEIRLEETCFKITDGAHYSPKGIEEGYPMLTIKNMREHGFDYSECKRISKEELKKMKQNDCVPQKNDVLVAKDGSYLKHIFTINETKKEAILSSIAIFRPNTEIICPDYLKYFFLNPITKRIVSDNYVSGSAIPRIVLKDFKTINILLPNIREQKIIADTLSALDNKIELNNKINKNLEQQAQAIFKHWFIDFEFPDENGKPYKSSGGEMIESELGMIPKGWKISKIKDISQDIVLGKTPSTSDKNNFGGKIPFLTIPDMHNRIYVSDTARTLSEQGVNTQFNKTVPINSICVSCIATPGLVTLTKEPTQTNQQINTIIPNVEYTYVYFLMKSISGKIISLGSGGTTTNNLNKTQFSNIDIILPIEMYRKKYHNIMESALNLVKINQEQNQQLSQLRDILLPKLMNGEIRIPLD